MPKRKGNPGHKAQPNPQKVPRQSPAAIPGDGGILWSFALFDDTGLWRPQGRQQDPFCDIAKHMRDYEGRTWKEIYANERRDHAVDYDRLSQEAQRRLEELQLDDCGELWRFRFGSAKRIWGLKEAAIFRVLWWDPEHRVCP